jgi:hypothetical protein
MSLKFLLVSVGMKEFAHGHFRLCVFAFDGRHPEKTGQVFLLRISLAMPFLLKYCCHSLRKKGKGYKL